MSAQPVSSGSGREEEEGCSLLRGHPRYTPVSSPFAAAHSTISARMLVGCWISGGDGPRRPQPKAPVAAAVTA
jgi:DNA-binding helix-hairpin-helix protein with protein kinase domain